MAWVSWEVEIAEAAVVEGEHLVEFAALEMVQAAVPPEVVDEVVAALPIGLQAGQPGDAFVVASLHLHDVGDAVRGPQVAGRQRDGLAPRSLGDGVVAKLLVRKAAARQQGRPAGQLRAPALVGRIGLRGHQVRAAMPEGLEVMQPERQHIEGMLIEDLLPHPQRAVDVAVDPSLQRIDVRALAPGGVRGQALGRDPGRRGRRAGSPH